HLELDHEGRLHHHEDADLALDVDRIVARDGPAVEALDQVEGPDGHAHPGAGEADPLGQGEGLDDGAGLVFDGVDDLHLPLDGELDGAVAGDGGVADLRVDHPAVHHPGGDAGEAGEGDGGALAHG